MVNPRAGASCQGFWGTRMRTSPAFCAFRQGPLHSIFGSYAFTLRTCVMVSILELYRVAGPCSGSSALSVGVTIKWARASPRAPLAHASNIAHWPVPVLVNVARFPTSSPGFSPCVPESKGQIIPTPSSLPPCQSSRIRASRAVVFVREEQKSCVAQTF